MDRLRDLRSAVKTLRSLWDGVDVDLTHPENDSKHVRGSPPASVIGTVRALAWPNVALGLTITAPDLCVYVRRWQAVGKKVVLPVRTGGHTG